MSFGLGADFSVFDGEENGNGEKRKAEEQPIVIDEKRLKDEDELELRSLLESLPAIETHDLGVTGCTHEVAKPKGTVEKTGRNIKYFNFLSHH